MVEEGKEVNRREGGGVKRRKEMNEKEEKKKKKKKEKKKEKKKSIRKKVWKASKKSLQSLMILGGVGTPMETQQRRRGEDIQMMSGVPPTQRMARRACCDSTEEVDTGSDKGCAALLRGESGSVYFDAAECFDEAPSTAEEHGLEEEEEEEEEATPSSCSSLSSTSSGAAAAAAAADHDDAHHGPRKRTRIHDKGLTDDAERKSSMEMYTARVEPVYRGTLPTEFYLEPPSTNLNIRGNTYLEDRIKVPAGEPAMDLVAVDLLEGDEPVHNVAAARNGTAQKILHNADRPLFVCNFVVPGATWINFVMYFQPRSSRVLLEDSSFARLFRRFREGDQEYRDASFKIIPQVVKGPWIVQRSVGSGSSSVPVILGRRLTIDYFCTPSYVEVDVNVHSSSVAASITKLVRSMTKLVVIDIAFLLEGKTEDELPEKLIGIFRMDHMPMTAATKFTPTPIPTPRTTRTDTRHGDDEDTQL